MAPIKRKSQPQIDESNKKLKQEEERLPVRSKIAETETDSDPLDESDTTWQSGEEDGTSWPSDEDPDDEGQWSGFDEDVEASKAGRDLSVAAEAAGVGIPEAKPNAQKDLNTSREAHAKQKAATKERKAAKPNADEIARSKKLWEKLRRKSHIPPEERKQLISELFDIITGRVKEYVFKHDSVRVIQTALKYATMAQNRMIATELKGEYKTLSESKYGKFLVGKLLSYGDKTIRDIVVPEFYGNVRRFIRHPEASWILDDVYRGAASPSQKAALLREWYGSEFAIFKATGIENASADLKQILDENPEKRKPIMRSLFDLINLLIQKQTIAFTMLHDAMLQYYTNLQPAGEEATNFIELLKGDEEGDLLKNLAFTKSGAYLVCLVLANSNAKDRKLVLRAYKNTFKMMAYDKHAHQILLTAYDVIDDSVLTSKQIFPELLGQNTDNDTYQDELLGQVHNFTARIPLIYLSAGDTKAYLHPPELQLLDEIHTIRTSSSKKDPKTRRQELLAHISPPLLSLIANRARDCVTTSYGCQFIMEAILSAPASCVAERQAALEALAAVVRQSENEGEEDLRNQLAERAGSRMLKNFVQSGHFIPAEKRIVPTVPALGFHDMLFQALKTKIIAWATGTHSFIVVSMMEAEGFEGKTKMRKILRKEKQKLEDAAAGKNEPGGRSESVGDSETGKEETAQRKGKGKRKNNQKKRGDEGRVSGNMGARMLLEMIDQ